VTWCGPRGQAWWLAIGGLALGAANPVLAHHSFAMFDTTNRVTVTGKVAVFEWTNPHVIIEIDGAEENGGLKRWTVELGSPGILLRRGWKYNDLKFGDKVIVVVNPLRSGEAGGLLVQATLADGRVLGNGTPPQDPR
jgi:hypothetical protein